VKLSPTLAGLRTYPFVRLTEAKQRLAAAGLPQPPPPTFASDTSHEFLDLGVPLAGFKLCRHRIFILQRQGHMPAAPHKMQ